MRSAASTDSDVLGLAENGDTFLLLVGEAKDGWYQIQYEGKTAYVSEDYVTVKEVSVEEAAKLRGKAVLLKAPLKGVPQKKAPTLRIPRLRRAARPQLPASPGIPRTERPELPKGMRSVREKVRRPD